MLLLILKIVISILLVVAIAEISKRSSPFLGGLLLGLPLGIGLTIYFIAYSEGIPFILKSIPWGLAGLAPSILFCSFYLAAGRLFKIRSRIISIVASSLFGLLFFCIAGFGLTSLGLNIFTALAIFLFVYIINIVVMRRLGIKGTASAGKGKGNNVITFTIRGLISGLIVVAVTGVASLVGSVWAGVLSAFPSTTYSLLAVLHFEEGEVLYPSVIYGFSYGVSTLAVFYVLCLLLLPVFGLNIGFVIIYILCFAYLFLAKAISGKLQKSGIFRKP